MRASSILHGVTLCADDDVATFAAGFHKGLRDATGCLTLSGELDIAAVPVLDRLLRHVESEGSPFVVDCSQLTFIDAAGIAALLRTGQHAAGVTGVRGSVRRTLTIVGLGWLERGTTDDDAAA